MALRNFPRVKLLLLLTDICSIVIASFMAIWLRYELSIIEEFNAPFQWEKFGSFVFLGLAFVPIFWEHDLYKHRVFQSSDDQVVRIFKSLCYGFVVLAIAFFLLRSGLIKHSRGNSILFIFSLFWVMVLLRVLVLRSFFRVWLKTESLAHPVIVIGAGSAGESFAALVMSNPSMGLHITGFLDDDPEKQGAHIMGYQVLGTVADLEQIVRREHVREIFITINAIEHGKLMEIVEACKKTNLPISLTSPHFRIVKKKRIASGEFTEIDAISLRQHISKTGLLLKQFMDFAVTSVLVLFLSPVLIFLALAVKLTSRGPILYKANAIGKNGRPFKMYKFRSMYVNNDQAAHKKLVSSLIHSGVTPGHKLTNDRRITPIGHYLRKFSLDELPQLFNVLKGEMSLIGPRPCLTYEYNEYKPWHKKRCSIRPGISGLWQVTGRSEVSFNDMIILDLYYIENFSIWLDFKIFLKTIPTVLLGRGAA